MAATIQRVPAESLHVSKPVWWLESRFHFSFADYSDGSRQSFGALRVVNDDLVKGNAGFGTHPHRDVEIFTYVIDGKVSHKDSMGNKEALPRGSVQYLSAGTGITHSEMNDDAETARFLQIWITPDRRGHKPNYGSAMYPAERRRNSLLAIMRGTGALPDWTPMTSEGSSLMHQDACALVSEADAGMVYDLQLGPNRQAYLICIEGSLKVNDVQLKMRDAAEVSGRPGGSCPLRIEAGAEGGAHFLIMEMALAK